MRGLGANGVETPYHKKRRLERDAADRRQRKIESERAYKKAAAISTAAENELSLTPPSEKELKDYLSLKQKEAENYIDRNDPDFPTIEMIHTWLPLTGCRAEDFLKKIRR